MTGNTLSFVPVKAIVFDVFGTLANIGAKRRPFAKLLRHLASNAHPRFLSDSTMLATALMSNDVDLEGALRLFGGYLCAGEMKSLADDLATEIASIALYPEAIETLTALRCAGVKIGLCSNLAAPYAEPVLRLLPFVFDAYAWSFQVGAVKPDPKMYSFVCEALQTNPKEVLMVGDTFEEDFLGPRRAGMQSVYLDRALQSPGTDTVSSLSEVMNIFRVDIAKIQVPSSGVLPK
jgi:HAD superfamily hydrolase (TIGR01509 family)